MIRSLEAQIKALAEPIEQLLATLPNTLSSVKGIGPVYAAGIVAEIGDIHRFPNHHALAKYAGLATLTARKLVRLVDHLLRSNRLYNPPGAPRRTR